MYSRSWSSWFPCVVRPHSQTNGTVVVYYHNGTDTIVKLLDPESPLMRTVKGPVYSIYCHSIKKMYSILRDRIRDALRFYEVKVDGEFSKKEYSCFTGRDLVRWLRLVHHGDHFEDEDVMIQLGNEMLNRGIIWRVKPTFSLDSKQLSSDEKDAGSKPVLKESEVESLSFVPKAEYMYALSNESAISNLIAKESRFVKEQKDRLYWTTKSRLGVYCSRTQKWEFGTVVSTFDPWLLVVYGQEDSLTTSSKWVHRLDVESVRHPRRFWRTGSQIWVFSRGDNQWYSGLVSSRETRYLGDHQVPLDENTLNVTYGPTDSQGAFTRTKPLKLSSEHIRPRVTRLSRMCIRVKSEGEPLQNVEEIKNKLAIYSKHKNGERAYYDAQPDICSLILVCREVEMTVRQRERESRLLSESHKGEVKVDVIPWEVFTAGRDVLYNLLKASNI